jgi:hypothetical protein
MLAVATGRGSLLTFHAVGGPIASPADLTEAAPLIGELLFLHLVNAGFWLARRDMVALTWRSPTPTATRS